MRAVVPAPRLPHQPGLFGLEPPSFDRSFASAGRRDLGDGAWIECVPGLVTGTVALFDDVLESAPWAGHTRPMYDRIVAEPRLTTRRWADPPALLVALADSLGERYGRSLQSISANLYRGGSDSVAWHGDRLGRLVDDTVVAIVSLGEPRRFLLRPKGGGESLRLRPGDGDLLVMGGTCQRTWQHCVPKCRTAGPRISVMFRERVGD